MNIKCSKNCVPKNHKRLLFFLQHKIWKFHIKTDALVSVINTVKRWNLRPLVPCCFTVIMVIIILIVIVIVVIVTLIVIVITIIIIVIVIVVVIVITIIIIVIVIITLIVIVVVIIIVIVIVIIVIVILFVITLIVIVLIIFKLKHIHYVRGISMQAKIIFSGWLRNISELLSWNLFDYVMKIHFKF